MMNLVIDPWIPVIFNDGSEARLSLNDTFLKARDIRDLGVRTYERVALMRLLVCITQAALNGPRDGDDWQGCEEQIGSKVLGYLKTWSSSFELFGEGVRFLQISGLSPIEKEDKEAKFSPTSKLDVALATGANTALFDNGAVIDGREFSPGNLALMLLTFQCFSPGGKIGVANWNRKETLGRGSSTAAPCIGSTVHTLIRSSNLLRTIRYNLITRAQADEVYGATRWGVPLWEAMPVTLDDTFSIQNATDTYLGRLVPLSRFIWLKDGSHMILANGLKYKPYPDFREATVTIVNHKQNKKGKSSAIEGRNVLQTSPNKSIWRQLQSIIVRDKNSKDSVGGPLTIQNCEDDESFDIWTGVLCNKQAKLLDGIESTFHIPARLNSDVGRHIYEQAVIYANKWAETLGNAVERYYGALESKGGENAKKRLRGIKEKAIIRFWTAVETALPCLFQLIDDITDHTAISDSQWGTTVFGLAQEAFDWSCPCTTSRQIEAFAKGKNFLIFPHNESKSKRGKI